MKWGVHEYLLVAEAIFFRAMLPMTTYTVVGSS